MDIYFFISERLKVISFLYETAAAPFIENMRKIEDGEPPYNAAPVDYDVESGEPAFIDKWQLNNDALMLLGHSTIAMLQVTLRLYLDSYKEEVERFHGKINWASTETKKARENWFVRYRQAFNNVLKIDWSEFGQELAVLEQIALARDDIFHHSEISTVLTYQSKQHFARYSEPFFADERYLAHFKITGTVPLGDTWAIDVPPEKIRKAIELVDNFCQFMESKWMSWKDAGS